MPRTVFYLVRHGAAEKEPRAGDAARRLTPEGRAAFEALVRALGPRLRLSRVLTSPFARARETAEILAAATGAPVEEEPALASGSSGARELLALGAAAGGGAALVGHNPEVAEAIALAAGRGADVRPGTIAEVEVEVGAGGAALTWLEGPQKS
jgi:phosphohistidine phosphatase